MKALFGSIHARLALAVFALTLAAAVPVLAQAPEPSPLKSEFHGFITLATGHDTYIDYVPAAPGKPLVVLLNGLTYEFGSWDSFVAQLKWDGLGLLRYDMLGQGQTLLKYAPASAPITLDQQTKDLTALLNALVVQQPVYLVGLSYGGAVGIKYTAENPDRVASLIMMSPFVSALPAQDDWVRYQITENRLLFPLNPATDDELYDYFLHVLVYTTYPAAEPVVLSNPYKLEAVFRLAQGMRTFDALSVTSQLPAGKINLMVAREDQYVPAAQHEALWNAIPQAARVSRLFIEGSEHKIPEAVPNFAAAWVKAIVNGDPRIGGGETFEGVPTEGTASANSTVITGLGK